MTEKDSLRELYHYATSKLGYTITPYCRHLNDLRDLLTDQKKLRGNTSYYYNGPKSTGDLFTEFRTVSTCVCNAEMVVGCECNARCACNSDTTCDCVSRCQCNSYHACDCNNRCWLVGCRCNSQCQCNALIGCSCDGRCVCNANIGFCDCQARCACNTQNNFDL